MTYKAAEFQIEIQVLIIRDI